MDLKVSDLTKHEVRSTIDFLLNKCTEEVLHEFMSNYPNIYNKLVGSNVVTVSVGRCNPFRGEADDV